MDLLERDVELEILESALDDAGTRSGSVVLIGGEAGIGKTRLVRSFAQIHADDARILWGACDDLSTPRTLGPLRDIALQVGGHLGEAVAAGTRGDVFDAAFETIAGGTRTTMAIIEDVHWADGATFDVLKFLGRRIEQTPTTLLLTYREEEVPADHPLMLVIGDLPASAVYRLHLKPLSKAAVDQLAAGYDGSTDGLFTSTRGNPFLVTEALMSSGGDIPANVRDAVRTRAARLSPQGLAVAGYISVVPSQTEFWLLEALPEFGPEALDECRQRGLIESDGRAAWYRHELVRGAMEESLTPQRRRALNALALESLVSRNADIARIVHHARRAGDAAAIAAYAPAAGRQASAASAHREALAHFRVAVDHVDELPTQQQAQLLTDYAIECYFTNEAVEGLAAAERALAAWRQVEDTTHEGDTLRWISRLQWVLGHSEEAITSGLAAVDVLSSVPRSKELAMAYSNLAQVFMLAQQADAAQTWAAKAIAVARELDDQGTLAHALNNLGSTMLRAGDMEGYPLLEESLDIALAGDFDDHGGRAYANLIWTALDYRQYAKAEQYLEDGLAYAWDRELAGSIYYITAERARLDLERGRWQHAETDALWVLNRPEEPGITQMPALATYARLRVRRGDPDAVETLEEAWHLAEPTGELQRIAPVAATRAEWAWLHNDLSGIRDAIAEAYRRAVEVQQPWITDELTFWMWRAGQNTEPLGGPTTPYALQMGGDWRGAADAWQAIGCPYEQAVALLDGDDPDCLLEALEILDGLGAMPAAAKLRRKLREMGTPAVPRGPRPQTRANPAGLTPRQAEVLELVATGLTNAEIADRLFVSPKTIDHHVSAILTKLGAGSRGEAAEIAETWNRV